MIESKRELARLLYNDSIDLEAAAGDPTWTMIFAGWSRALKAEARSAEIQMHNQLWNLGQQMRVYQEQQSEKLLREAQARLKGRIS